MKEYTSDKKSLFGQLQANVNVSNQVVNSKITDLIVINYLFHYQALHYHVFHMAPFSSSLLVL